MAPTKCHCCSSHSKQYRFDANRFFQLQSLARYLLVHSFEDCECINCAIHGETCFIINMNISKNLVFCNVPINECAKYNCLWKSLSVNWCPTQISSGNHLNLLRVMQLNDHEDGPSPFRRAITFALCSNNVRTLSTFSPVVADQLLSEFLLFLFRLVPKLRYFAALFWVDFLQRFAIDWQSELSLKSYKTLSFNIVFNNKNSFFSC